MSVAESRRKSSSYSYSSSYSLIECLLAHVSREEKLEEDQEKDCQT